MSSSCAGRRPGLGGDGVVYFRRLSAALTRSRMSRIVARPEYQRMTIRSWSTTTKLLDLLDHAEHLR